MFVWRIFGAARQASTRRSDTPENRTALQRLIWMKAYLDRASLCLVFVVVLGAIEAQKEVADRMELLPFRELLSATAFHSWVVLDALGSRE